MVYGDKCKCPKLKIDLEDPIDHPALTKVRFSNTIKSTYINRSDSLFESKLCDGCYNRNLKLALRDSNIMKWLI